MRRLLIGPLMACLALVGILNCTGTFALTRTWDRFINNLGNKWISSVAFVLAVYFRFYMVVLLVDMIVLNSVEFWGGKNPVVFDEKGEHRKTMKKGDERADITYKKFGREMEIRILKNGRSVNRLLLRKNQRGVFYTFRRGRWLPIHIQEERKQGFPHLHVLVGGQRVKSRLFSTAEYARLLKTASGITGEPVHAASPPSAPYF